MNAGDETLRVFIGIELSDDVRCALTEIQSELGGMVADARWIRPENLHLTLKFLGNCPRGKVEEVVEALELMGKYLPCGIDLGGLGGFPSPRSARIIWVGVEDIDGRLEEMWRSCEKACRGLGFEKEKRKYHPHITIGRCRKSPAQLPWTGLRSDESLLPMVVDSITLFRSILKRTGAEHSVVHRVYIPRYSESTQIVTDEKG